MEESRTEQTDQRRWGMSYLIGGCLTGLAILVVIAFIMLVTTLQVDMF